MADETVAQDLRDALADVEAAGGKIEDAAKAAVASVEKSVEERVAAIEAKLAEHGIHIN